VVEVRPSHEGEWSGLSPPRWVAVDSEGRRFGGDDEAEARRACERYNAGRFPLYGAADRVASKLDAIP
jgi:hypothetical protein